MIVSSLSTFLLVQSFSPKMGNFDFDTDTSCLVNTINTLTSSASDLPLSPGVYGASSANVLQFYALPIQSKNVQDGVNFSARRLRSPRRPIRARLPELIIATPSLPSPDFFSWITPRTCKYPRAFLTGDAKSNTRTLCPLRKLCTDGKDMKDNIL